ncbi:hypothetical protein DFJ73DRAFT_776651 [Zopfochytrium polystomum]|nr:hypothetical protein DFJ73DRAFT_776651 [Zopfochytrium polystomum]
MSRTFDSSSSSLSVLWASAAQLANAAVQRLQAAVRRSGLSVDAAVRGLLLLGYTLCVLGIMAGFRGALMVLGQLLIISSYLVKLGLRRAWMLVYRPERIRGTVFLVAGFLLTLLHFTAVGFVLEVRSDTFFLLLLLPPGNDIVSKGIGLACLNDYDRLWIL